MHHPRPLLPQGADGSGPQIFLLFAPDDVGPKITRRLEHRSIDLVHYWAALQLALQPALQPGRLTPRLDGVDTANLMTHAGKGAHTHQRCLADSDFA